MKSYIKSIFIFNDTGEYRQVRLEPGVNIITGDSKTGKSALVEIIDYCLCSSKNTIPKGKISNFATIYALTIVIGNNLYVIGRRQGAGNFLYFSKENIDFDEKEITKEYFNSTNSCKLKDGQEKIETALKLNVTNMDITQSKEKQKASLRNMVSYLFQHQNLIANKFALFYRFDTSYKRTAIVEQFPIFAGIVTQEYYSDIIELNDLYKELNRLKKIKTSNSKIKNFAESHIIPLIEDYYALLNIPFMSKQYSTQEIFKMGLNLPEVTEKTFISNEKIIERYKDLKIKLEKELILENEIRIKLNKIQDTKEKKNDYTENLLFLQQQAKVIDTIKDEYTCPLCGNKCEGILIEDEKLKIASDELEKEIQNISKYDIDFSEDTRKLKKALDSVKNAIKSLIGQIQQIESKYIVSTELKNKYEKINYIKAKIKLYIKSNISNEPDDIDQEIEVMKKNIEKLENKIKQFNVEKKKKEAQNFICKNMNRLAENLDFEEEFKPINLVFDIENDTFDLYHQISEREKITLSEMGSGANWVSCHIALFLSLLRYFCSRKNSPMLLTMFFDQPSQVYFPQNNIEVSATDLKAVNKIYKTIFDEIISIEKDTKILPQILIVDHVDGNDLEVKEEFLSYIREEWRNTKALI